jgi:hypothetical protein
MDLLKKHYEKIILGGVLLVLALGAAALPLMITGERDTLREQEISIVSQPARPLEPLNFSTQQVALVQLRNASGIDFSTGHKVLNPYTWQRTPEGQVVVIREGDETGAKALVVTKATPLYLNITLDGVNLSEATPRYTISVERQAAAERSRRTKKPYFTTLNTKNEAFLLREVSGPADNPVLKLELTENGEIIEISKDRPLNRVDGYMVDLRYTLENRPPWTGQRVGSTLTFGGETYNIVAITKTEVVLLARSNQKKTPVPIPQE